MISGGEAGDYVQSGFVRWYGHAAVYFNEYSAALCGSSCFYLRLGTTATYGQTHTYGEGYAPSCSCDYSKIDGSVKLYTNFNPYDWWATGWGPEYLGETKWYESDMPGNSGSPTGFSNLQYQWNGDDQFANWSCNQLQKVNPLAGVTRPDGESWYDQITSCPSFKIFADTAGL